MTLTVMLTGATAGLGRTLASLLARHPLCSRLIVHGRSVSQGAALVSELQQLDANTEVEYINGDLSDCTEVETLAASATLLGKVDLLINNAGLFCASREETQLNRTELTHAVNMYSAYFLSELLVQSKALGPGSCVLHISSAASTHPYNSEDPDYLCSEYNPYGAYASSKAGLVMLSAQQALRLKAAQIRVNSVNPLSFMATKMLTDAKVAGLEISEQNEVSQGAEVVLDVALGAEWGATTGAYFDGDMKASGMSLNATSEHPHLKDDTEVLQARQLLEAHVRARLGLPRL